MDFLHVSMYIHVRHYDSPINFPNYIINSCPSLPIIQTINCGVLPSGRKDDEKHRDNAELLRTALARIQALEGRLQEKAVTKDGPDVKPDAAKPPPTYNPSGDELEPNEQDTPIVTPDGQSVSLLNLFFDYWGLFLLIFIFPASNAAGDQPPSPSVFVVLGFPIPSTVCYSKSWAVWF